MWVIVSAQIRTWSLNHPAPTLGYIAQQMLNEPLESPVSPVSGFVSGGCFDSWGSPWSARFARPPPPEPRLPCSVVSSLLSGCLTSSFLSLVRVLLAFADPTRSGVE